MKMRFYQLVNIVSSPFSYALLVLSIFFIASYNIYFSFFKIDKVSEIKEASEICSLRIYQVFLAINLKLPNSDYLSKKFLNDTKSCFVDFQNLSEEKEESIKNNFWDLSESLQVKSFKFLNDIKKISINLEEPISNTVYLQFEEIESIKNNLMKLLNDEFDKEIRNLSKVIAVAGLMTFIFITISFFRFLKFDVRKKLEIQLEQFFIKFQNNNINDSMSILKGYFSDIKLPYCQNFIHHLEILIQNKFDLQNENENEKVVPLLDKVDLKLDAEQIDSDKNSELNSILESCVEDILEKAIAKNTTIEIDIQQGVFLKIDSDILSGIILEIIEYMLNNINVRYEERKIIINQNRTNDKTFINFEGYGVVVDENCFSYNSNSHLNIFKGIVAVNEILSKYSGRIFVEKISKSKIKAEGTKISLVFKEQPIIIQSLEDHNNFQNL